MNHNSINGKRTSSPKYLRGLVTADTKPNKIDSDKHDKLRAYCQIDNYYGCIRKFVKKYTFRHWKLLFIHFYLISEYLIETEHCRKRRAQNSEQSGTGVSQLYRRSQLSNNVSRYLSRNISIVR